VTVTILDRPRHQEIIDEVRAAGARIRLIMDGDVAAAIQAAMEDYKAVDVYLGIGGAPEAVLAAAALKCIGGQILCQVWPRTDEERAQLERDGVNLNRVYTVDDLISTDKVSFAATGITTGELLKGVEYTGTGARTHSVMMRGHTGTIRFIEGVHRWRN
jgi:fructose-1,6-bisphosphatase II